MFSEACLTPFSSMLPWDMAGPVTVGVVAHCLSGGSQRSLVQGAGVWMCAPGGRLQLREKQHWAREEAEVQDSSWGTVRRG